MPRSAAARIDEALRDTGRLVAFAGLAAVIFFVFGIVLKPLFPDGLPLGEAGRQLYLILLVVALGLSQLVVVAVGEKSRWRLTGMGPDGWPPVGIAMGLALGLVVQGVPLGVAAFTGLGEPGTMAWAWPTRDLLLLAVASTLVDALMLRGYLIGLLAAHWGEAMAVGATVFIAVVLAVLGDAPTLSAALLAGTTAAFLGAVRLRTGSLAAAWVAHLAMTVLVDAAGRDSVPFVTAVLSGVVSFLLFVRRPGAVGPGHA